MNDDLFGPHTQEGDSLHAMKYRARKEDFREAVNRWSFHLKDNDEHYHQLREVLGPMRFLMAGRVQSAAGSKRDVTAFNCFVSGVIGDHYVGRDSIMRRAEEAAATMRMGGGIGYDFSTIRQRGALIRGLQSTASGPVSFMQIYDSICQCTSSSGHRRGAQMGVLRVDHPDIEEFILAKQNDNNLTGFNISVAVTDEFMECVAAKKDFDLRFNGDVVATVQADELWNRILRSTWEFAEPGVLFIDAVNRMNNLKYCETIAATNPCGEQPLPPYGACLLGSFNLVKYLKKGVKVAGGEVVRIAWDFDWDLFKNDIPIVVRAMDNVTDRTRYPLAEQKSEAISKRRMGLGVTALANAGEAMGMPYGSQEFLEFEARILSTLRDEAYIASAMLAKAKGAFPLYDQERYCDGEFFKTLPEHVRDIIRRHGLRNSHLTSIAPTGTISMCADNVSSSIEPVFALETERTVNTPEGPVKRKVQDYGARELGVLGKTAPQVTAKEHVDVLTTAQKFVDSAVSKTVNMDSGGPNGMKWPEFENIYRRAWELGAKGCTTFNLSGKRGALLSNAEKNEAACRIDEETGRRECS